MVKRKSAMPPALTKAHAALDKAVDRCYRRDPFPSDRRFTHGAEG